eukprot:1389153-Amphidinium_carterae.1
MLAVVSTATRVCQSVAASSEGLRRVEPVDLLVLCRDCLFRCLCIMRRHSAREACCKIGTTTLACPVVPRRLARRTWDRGCACATAQTIDRRMQLCNFCSQVWVLGGLFLLSSCAWSPLIHQCFTAKLQTQAQGLKILVSKL